jgi:Zn-dependent peptidase ImmA (M78 family)
MKSKEFRRIPDSMKPTVESFLEEYPVRLGALARDLGVPIKVASMKTGVSGQISRDGEGYLIRVNRNEARERQRFTIAHELAHYFLHKEVIDRSPDGITDNVLYRSGAPETIEYEANRLAADLVMPMNMVERRLREDFGGVVTEATIEGLAEAFEVSKAAMEIRLSTLVAG